jgi:uncharacterized protein (DUF302 family)
MQIYADQRAANLVRGLIRSLKGGGMKSYYFSKTLKIPFDDAVARVIAELKKEDFGILTDIDVQETLKKKLNVDFKKYRILGACNPPFAYKALKTEDKIGTMLPCNVIVQEHGESVVEVSAVDPMESMRAVQNPELEGIAGQVQAKLKRVIDHL